MFKIESKSGQLGKNRRNDAILPGLTVDRVRASTGGGRPLNRSVRDFFEPRFGYDFSRVRVRSDETASRSAREIGAHAYTLENQLVFDVDHYRPQTRGGLKLLAHELTHVVQQGHENSGRIAISAVPTNRPTIRRSNGNAPSAAPGCATTQMSLIENARRAAAIRCQIAGFRTKGIVPPTSRPGAPDPGTQEQRRAARIARTIFGEDLNMAQVGEIVSNMGYRLASDSLSVTCASPTDTNCGNRAAYVVGNRPPIHLCPAFFNNPGPAGDEQRTRTMIHEAAHLEGIGQPNGESYCGVFDCSTSCGGFDAADSWAHYVHCISGQTPDQPPTVTGTP